MEGELPYLPTEIWREVFCFLPTEMLPSVLLVCRRFHDARKF